MRKHFDLLSKRMVEMSKKIRKVTSATPSVLIGGAGGFWGDRTYAPVDMLTHNDLDYITMDYLAEVTMSIMSKSYSSNPKLGWATDLERWLKKGGISLLREKGVRLVTNAGGVNPVSCAQMVLDVACSIGWTNCQVAVVTGDNVLSILHSSAKEGEQFQHMFDKSKEPLLHHDEIIAANAYLGAGPIGRSIAKGADIVITGRVADASLIVGCMLHASGWAQNAENESLPICGPIHTWSEKEEQESLDLLAGWSVAGHLIECGAQVCGGNFTNLPANVDISDISYPIAKISFDGSSIITKSKGGGIVNRASVIEQLLYEIDDPSNYITPDVIVDISMISIEELGDNQVKVSSVSGRIPPERLKISSCYHDAYFITSQLLVPGPEPLAKAQQTDKILRKRVAHLKDIIIETEFIGAGASLPLGLRILLDKTTNSNPREILVRWGVSSTNRQSLNVFASEIAPLVLTGPAGVSGYSARSKPRKQLAFFPTSIGREHVEEQVEITFIHTLRSKIEERYPWLKRNLTTRIDNVMMNSDSRTKLAVARLIRRRLHMPRIWKAVN